MLEWIVKVYGIAVQMLYNGTVGRQGVWYMAYSLGIDYGTNSVRALLVDCDSGAELASAVFNYPSGNQGILLDARDPHLARQHPGDYLAGLEWTVKTVLEKSGVPGQSVIGIGVDTTGSSPIPVNRTNEPLALLPEWQGNLSAQCWLWKDHTSAEEALAITRLARQHRPHFVAKCGNTYSSEWFWSKLWHCRKTAPEVFAAAWSWVELADFIPAVLCGIKDPLQIRRGICAAGHKALYSDEWGGLPDKEFLALLDPELAQLRDRLYAKAYDASTPAGQLCTDWAAKLGLRSGIPVAIGAFDVHYGAIGCGVDTGVLVKAIGTSACDCGVVPLDANVGDIPGICGVVPGAILPGYLGIEAGQSAVGDIFKWFVEYVCKGDAATHGALTAEAAELRPGQSGLLALDWNNGNRTVLVDPYLSGLLVGQTLHTSQAEIYRALIEGTAFGARIIIERLKSYGVPIQRVVCCGGIAEKNPMLMQIYADVTGCSLEIAESAQACALGAAMTAAVLAGPAVGGFADFAQARERMTGVRPTIYRPNPESAAVYEQLFALYVQLHDAFGGVATTDLSHVMKDLLRIQREQSKS